MKALSPKERRFVAEYLKDQNGTQAAIRAGYSKRSSGELAYRLLKKDQIKAAIHDKLSQVEASALVDATFVIGGLRRVAERCMTEVPVMVFDHEEKQMVEKRTWVEDPGNPGKLKMVGVYEFDSTGANRSLELLGKHLKLFTEKVEHTIDEDAFERLENSRKRAADA